MHCAPDSDSPAEKKAPRVLSSPAIPVAVLLLTGALLIPLYRYQINPDAVTYISIAEKYARGDLYNAINGHAYPLISWLLVPFLWLGVDPLMSTKTLNLLLACATLPGLHLLCRRAGLDRRLIAVSLFSSLPALLYFAFSIVTPDLLLTTVLLYYHLFALSARYPENRRAGVLCGLAGGLAYLAKSYGMIFFLAHFPLLNAWYFLRRSPGTGKTLAWNFASGMLIFLLLCGAWSGIISMKYGQVTSSNQGSVILSAISPHPYKGPDTLVPPPNDSAVSIWEDPRAVLQHRSWSPFDSPADFRYWLSFILRNIRVTIGTFWLFSAPAVCLCLVFLFCVLRCPERFHDLTAALYLPATLALYAGGYCPLIADERYLWPLFFLFMVISMHGLARVLDTTLVKKTAARATGLIVLTALSFAVTPVDRLVRSAGIDREIHDLSRQLQPLIPPGSKLVSDSDWYRSLFVAYYLRGHLYGTAENIPAAKLEKELHTHEIDYFLRWGKTQQDYPFLAEYRKIPVPSPDAPQVFALRPPDAKGR